MIRNSVAEKLKSRTKDDFGGRHFEARLIIQAVSSNRRDPLSRRDVEGFNS
jgi:transposase, IS6 family